MKGVLEKALFRSKGFFEFFEAKFLHGFGETTRG